MHLCTYIPIPIYLCTYAPMYLCTYIPMHLYTYAPIYLCTYIPMHHRLDVRVNKNGQTPPPSHQKSACRQTLGRAFRLLGLFM
jgi:hypothetical protein